VDGLTLITGPAFEPVTLAQAKLHCRVDSTDEDSLITSLIVAARSYIETKSGRAIAAQTWRLDLECFPASDRIRNQYAAIVVPMPPLASVTLIEFYDIAGTLQELDPSKYQVNTGKQPGEIRPFPGGEWPDVEPDRVAGVQVTFVAGVANEAAIDARIKQAVLLMVGHWYANREAVGNVGKTLEHAVDAICFQLWDGKLH
jgi:uncharacterized phiE125 gp8 family phage protein